MLISAPDLPAAFIASEYFLPYTLVVGIFLSVFWQLCFYFCCLGWLLSAYSISTKGHWFWPLLFPSYLTKGYQITLRLRYSDSSLNSCFSSPHILDSVCLLVYALWINEDMTTLNFFVAMLPFLVNWHFPKFSTAAGSLSVSFHNGFFPETLQMFVASHLRVSLFTFYEKCWCLDLSLCLDLFFQNHHLGEQTWLRIIVLSTFFALPHC